MIRPKAHIGDIYRTPAPGSSRIGSLRMDKNEFLPCWPDEWFKDFMKSVGCEHFSIHPELGGLYDKLERTLGIQKTDIVVTAGSDAAIRSAFEVFVEPGDEVIIPSPTFAMYYIYSKIYRAKLIEARYNERFELDIAGLKKAISADTKLIAIANPNSPTGTVIKKADLVDIIERASRVGSSVLIDEAYYPFYEDSMIDHVEKFDNLMITRTFSKAAGLAGMRVGFLASNPKIAKLVFAVKPMYEVTTLSTILAEYVLDHYERVFEYAAKTREGREYLADFLAEKGFEVFRGYANFLHVDFGPKRNEIIGFLKKRGVLFKDSFEDPSLKRFSRFTVGPIEAVRPLIKILTEFVEGVL